MNTITYVNEKASGQIYCTSTTDTQLGINRFFTGERWIVFDDENLIIDGQSLIDYDTMIETVPKEKLLTAYEWQHIIKNYSHRWDYERKGVWINEAVFLPAAGFRSGSRVTSPGFCGYYWTPTHCNEYDAFAMIFDNSYLDATHEFNRGYGYSIRLVTTVNPNKINNMETKTIKIDIPEGYEIDREKSTFENIVFKKKGNILPSTWEEFCRTHPLVEGETCITISSQLKTLDRLAAGMERLIVSDANYLPNRETAVAVLTLCRLIQLRDCYNDGWKPDWTDVNTCKYTIIVENNEIGVFNYYTVNKILAFKTEELRAKFLRNFKDLIEEAKPLL